MLARLREARVPARLVVKKNAGHGWYAMADDMRLCADWFDEYLAHLDRPAAAE
jgi:hypothetical protein